MLDTIADILHKIRMDNTLKESLNETLKDAEPELTTLANTATHNILSLRDYLPVTIRGTSSVQSSLKATNSISKELRIYLREAY